jgi:hypothetical protein
MPFFKFLDENGHSPYSHFFWPLPKNDEPGDWLPEVAELIECKSGYHFTDTKNLFDWLGPRAFLFEPAGKVEQYSNKYASTGGRLIRELSFPYRDSCITLGSLLALLREFDEVVEKKLPGLYDKISAQRAYPYRHGNTYALFREIEAGLCNAVLFPHNGMIQQTLSFSNMAPYPNSLIEHMHAFRLMSEVGAYRHVEYSRHLLKCLIILKDALSDAARYLCQRCFSYHTYVFDDDSALSISNVFDGHIPAFPSRKYSVVSGNGAAEVLDVIAASTSKRFSAVLASLFNAASSCSETNGEKQ